MTRLMYDSVTAADIPAGSQLVAGYVDGRYRWSESDWQLHRGKVLVRIATSPETIQGADVLDVEPGNGDAAAAAKWVQARRALGFEPTVYCFSDAGPAGYRISDVRRECAALGVEPPLFWIAQWDNDPSTFDPHGDPTIIAKQHAGSAQTGGHYDASVVADHWPGVDRVDQGVPVLPQLVAQSSDFTDANAARIGQVCWLQAIFEYANGRRATIVEKVIPRAPGRYVYRIYPWVDPDADPTRELSATPALFLVYVPFAGGGGAP